MTASKVRVPTPEEIRTWPATVSVPTAGSPWGVGPRGAYDLARRGEFPVPVLRLGSKLRVTRSSIMAALAIPEVAPTEVGLNQEAA